MRFFFQQKMYFELHIYPFNPLISYYPAEIGSNCSNGQAPSRTSPQALAAAHPRLLPCPRASRSGGCHPPPPLASRLYAGQVAWVGVLTLMLGVFRALLPAQLSKLGADDHQAGECDQTYKGHWKLSRYYLKRFKMTGKKSCAF